ncbi:MAG: imidazoleglycerol-phosphate dehydratase [Methanomassiliicoccus sp.]|nr:imidazoleglycerol-phosphate dehydratase [Methanomassiliicoccus sp.]
MIREAKLSRKTKETSISLSLFLDGSGKAKVTTDDQFLKHMMETLTRYASFDLTMDASGDNDHHLVEDVAIALGAAFRQALGDLPVDRIASAMVPMDDALVTAAVDIVDRPYCDTDCPDPLYSHFLRSFSMSSGITLHVIVHRGLDDHHVIEATFKALGLALKKAIVPRENVLSTKDAVRFRSG